MFEQREINGVKAVYNTEYRKKKFFENIDAIPKNKGRIKN
jgi:hypothetical protein